MKTLAIFFSIFLLLTCQAFTQGGSGDKISYDAWVSRNSAPKHLSGTIHEIRDTAIMLKTITNSPWKEGKKENITAIDIRTIDVVSVRKKGNATRGLLIGAGAGAALGAAIDLALWAGWDKEKHGGNDLEEAFNEGLSAAAFGLGAAAIGIVCLGAGIGIGVGVGSAKINIPINGSKDQYNQNKVRLNEYATISNPELAAKTFSKLKDTITDFDGNRYPTLALGGQVWMAGNLRSTHFRDGSPIPGTLQEASETLYSWTAVSDPRGICPQGWHVPTMKEWTSMMNSLGDEHLVPQKLSVEFTSSSGQNHWWTSTAVDSLQSRTCYINPTTQVIMFTGVDKGVGLSVRCLRN